MNSGIHIQKSALLLMRKMFVFSVFLFATGLFPLFTDGQILKTEVHFKTTNTALQQVYDKAEEKAQWNISRFGSYQVLVEGAQYKNVWLETQPMGGYMYAKRNLEIARNNILIFIDNQREDGRMPGMLSYRNNQLVAHYGWFQGYCFPMPAFELYFWLGKDQDYLRRLYHALEKFDAYLWKTRDSDGDGCLETWCIWDNGEDDCVRLGTAPNSWPFDFPPTEERIKNMSEDELKNACCKTSFDFQNFPVPIESMDIMSYSYAGRDVLARISRELNNGQEVYWRQKADEIQAKLKNYLWDEQKHACFDRDKNNQVMNVLLHNNLRCMYFGSFDQQMADEFVKFHLMNPAEFWTPMPLPSIAANDPAFRNISGNNWSGQPQGLTFQRSIRALENYGHYAELTLIGQKFLKAISDSLKFTQQFDPFTGTINNSKDGYGPSILASLEFISRMYGIHLSENRILWSCLDDANKYSYSQQWGSHQYEMTTHNDQVRCSIDGKEAFSFSRGIRVVTDLSGKILELVGIDSDDHEVLVSVKGTKSSVWVKPNAVYRQNNGKYMPVSVHEFCRPD